MSDPRLPDGPVGDAAPGAAGPIDDAVSFGVAIAVPAPYGPDLQERRASFGDDQARMIPTHITLLPPDELPLPRIDDLTVALEQVAARTAPFGVSLQGTGSFRPVSPVVFVAVSRGIAEAELLQQDLRASVQAPPAEFPYHPHVTVAHHLDEDGLDRAYAELADYACDFVVEEFSLYVHDDRAGWSPRTSFPLTGSGAPAR